MKDSGSPRAASSDATGLFQEYVLGDCLHSVRIRDDWRVVDVGSGQSPHSRADVLLERYPEDDSHRSGDPVDATDPRLVIGDACDMPFGDLEFDYVIASHVAEHVDDPEAFCREVTRVGRRGYIETPGWLGDMLLREAFHRWRVYKRDGGLYFERVVNPRPLGRVADVFYAFLYAGVHREGHRTLMAEGRVGQMIIKAIRRVMVKAIWLPLVRDLMYMQFEWSGPFEVTIGQKSQPRSTNRRWLRFPRAR